LKQGLLFRESPEPRTELYCYHCVTYFYTVYEYQQHRKKVHKEIYSLCWNGYGFYGHWRELSDTAEDSIDALKDDNGNFIQALWSIQTRPTQRCKAKPEEILNLRSKKCWCGKERKDFDTHQRKYCTKRHASTWWARNISVGDHRSRYLYKHNNKCDTCGKKHESSYNMEMDHIIAIILGGHPWDHRNLQALCSDCHKEKTKSDVKILAWWRRDSNYDTGFGEVTQQTILETYIVEPKIIGPKILYL